jgi:predicted ATP-dependent endonuclease of OLD family
MKINKIDIKDFRNITKAEIEFGNINVFTGKNSSGKTNFLLAISSALKTKKDLSEEFSGNNVTISQGKRNTTFKTTVAGIDTKTCFVKGSNKNNPDDFFCLSPDSFTFENVINKDSSSFSHRLFFSGTEYQNTDPRLTWQDFSKNEALYKDRAKKRENELVYEKKFSTSQSINGTNVVQESPLGGISNHFSAFQDLHKGVITQIREGFKTIQSSPVTTALSIHDYVTDKGNEQVYQEALKRSRHKDQINSIRTGLEKSGFIFLVADISNNKVVKEKYAKDLETYTDGIVKNIIITPKGTLSVLSPNGPDGIWTMSNGTSVLVFFITLINWLNLSYSERSYNQPHVLLLDETDAIVHPTILNEFIELLRGLSKKVQIFITTHSPYFLNGFERNEIYYIKDAPAIAEKTRNGVQEINRCNIYKYETILGKISPENRDLIIKKSNAELFCDGVIESLFPIENL